MSVDWSGFVVKSNKPSKFHVVIWTFAVQTLLVSVGVQSPCPSHAAWLCLCRLRPCWPTHCSRLIIHSYLSWTACCSTGLHCCLWSICVHVKNWCSFCHRDFSPSWWAANHYKVNLLVLRSAFFKFELLFCMIDPKCIERLWELYLYFVLALIHCFCSMFRQIKHWWL